MSRFLKSIGLVVVVLALSGCARTIYNVEEKRVSQSEIKTLSTKQVRNIIVEAAKDNGWDVAKVKPGLLSARIKWNTHVANIEIPYSSKSYSINYVKSVNLIINKTKIHHRYNSLVLALEKAIDLALDEAANS